MMQKHVVQSSLDWPTFRAGSGVKANRKSEDIAVISTSNASVLGGMFGLELFESNISLKAKQLPFFLSGRQRLLATARSAVKLLVQALRPATVWLPSYICGVVIDAAREADVRIRFYEVDPSLKIPDHDWLAAIQAGDVVIFADYFGFDTWSSHGAEAGARGAHIVEDACQAMLNKNFSSHSDYIIFSPRKFIGVPDGGILLAGKNAELRDADFPPPPAQWLLRAVKASILRSEFDRYGGERSWFKMFQSTEAHGPMEPCRMSDLSAAILRIVNWATIKRRRRRNYEFLLSELGELAIFPNLPRHVVPLGFPIRVRNRDRVRQLLFKEQIYPAVHWDIADLVPTEFAASHRLASEILTLPSDQRYGRDDMKRMVGKLKRYISQ
jgi:Predicted pyridoxal phosphate-dependent enzyme apparently involved in regulation of cell wall biogenesis